MKQRERERERDGRLRINNKESELVERDDTRGCGHSCGVIIHIIMEKKSDNGVGRGGGGAYGERDPLWKQSHGDDVCEKKHDGGGGGGAYPEVRRWQYPLDMGRNGEEEEEKGETSERGREKLMWN